MRLALATALAVAASAGGAHSSAQRGGGACTTPLDCHWAGRCVSNACSCDVGWTGSDCGSIHLGKSNRCGEGGLCIAAPASGVEDVLATWGGGVVTGDDGKFHMFAAGMSHGCPLSSWLTNSVVVHSVSESPNGPYTPADVSLSQDAPGSSWDWITKHNPTAARSSNGTYLLYYMGSSSSNASSLNCTSGQGQGFALGAVDCSVSPEAQPVCNQRVGLATAPSPSGPWTRRDTPIMGPGPAGEWDDLFTANPTVHVFPNDSVILVYKGRSTASSSLMHTGVAYADHWAGPYTRSKPSVPFEVGTRCEDAGMYYAPDMGVFRLVMHCDCNYQYMWSLDGLNWKATVPPAPWCNVTYTDGSVEAMARRERPQWFVKDGVPAYLFNGVLGGSHGSQTWTLATEVL